MNPRGQGVDEDLVNLGLIVIAAVGFTAAVLRLAGSAAAWLFGAPQPKGGWESGFRVLSHPGDPATEVRDWRPLVAERFRPVRGVVRA